MSYTPGTDFVALFRNLGGSYVKLDMPSLDFVMAALGRSGLITISVSATAPLANQNVTAWFKPAAPSYSGEGAFYLWDPVAAAYAPATAALLWDLLNASAGASGVSWWMTAGGPPANIVGNNGDLALRTDFPGGIYGPKVNGAWPALPIPGTTYAVDSTALDASFGAAEGNMLVRGAAAWQSLAVGTNKQVLAVSGTDPSWTALSAILDAIGATRGTLLYRGAAAWQALAAGTPGYYLTTQGAAADPTWTVPGAEFVSGTVMLFRQTAAPVNWTKQTATDDAALRVTSGAVGSGGTVGFNTLFATTAVGNTTITTATMPSHNHSVGGLIVAGGAATNTTGTWNSGSGTTSNTGGDGAHSHSLDMRVKYLDIIIATKN
jgi:hypothetical protein